MIIGIIIAIILIALIVGVGFLGFVVLQPERDYHGRIIEENPIGSKVRGLVYAIFGILIALFLIVPFSFHTVDTGEIAVVKKFGEIKDVKESGMHFDLWITNKYVKYDTKVQNVEAQTMAYSSDAQMMDIQMTVQYRIRSSDVVHIATQYGSLSVLENRISSVVVEKTKSVLSSYKAMDIIADRASISPLVEMAIKDAIDEEYFVDIVTVVLTNIDFSDSFELAVEEKMIAEQAKLKADYENETKIAKAEADAEAKLKEAKAKIEIAKAEAEARMIAAEAEAEANKIIEQSLTDNIIKKALIDNWNGEMPKVIGQGDYMLPTSLVS